MNKKMVVTGKKINSEEDKLPPKIDDETMKDIYKILCPIPMQVDFNHFSLKAINY